PYTTLFRSRDLVGFAYQFQLVANHVEHAALLEAGAGFLVGEHDRHCDLDLRILGETQEIDMDRTVADRMERNILGQGADLLATDVDHDDRVHEVAHAELARQLLGFHVNRGGFFLAAVNHSGDAAFATQCTGGSLASPIARLSHKRQSVAHFLYLSRKWCFRRASRDDHGGSAGPYGKAQRNASIPAIARGRCGSPSLRA